MNQPTPAQSTWLRNYYRTFGKQYLADHLGIGITVLNRWLRQLNLKYHRVNAILTDDHKQFIAEHYRKWTHEKIAIELKLPVSTVRGYCDKAKLKKAGKHKVQAVPKQIIRVKEEAKMERPPTTYSNTSREQHVEKWINTELPAQKQKRIGYNTNKKTA